MAAERVQATASSSRAPVSQEMRITSGGRIAGYVGFALKFLEEHPERALVLHTISPKDSISEIKEILPPDATPEPPPPAQPPRVEPKMPQSSLAIQKLISVVEIIKREYLKTVEDSMVGLYQYNELGCVGDLEKEMDVGPASAAKRANDIVDLLKGTKNVRIRRTPYMKVTLSVKEIRNLSQKRSSVTTQPPAQRLLSKSAKGRLRKRLKKAAAAKEGEAPVQDMQP